MKLRTVGRFRPRGVAFLLACCALGIVLGTALFGCGRPSLPPGKDREADCVRFCAKSGLHMHRYSAVPGLLTSCECQVTP